jgi:putative FmdB family regulatory protein
MPTYDFKCLTCTAQVSETCSMEELNPSPPCNDCNGTLTRVYSVPVVTFNGSGFYSTDKAKP